MIFYYEKLNCCPIRVSLEVCYMLKLWSIKIRTDVLTNWYVIAILLTIWSLSGFINCYVSPLSERLKWLPYRFVGYFQAASLPSDVWHLTQVYIQYEWMEQALPTLLEHFISPTGSRDIPAAQSLVFCVVFCRSLFVLLNI